MAIARGEIYFVNLSPVQGREQAGTRPVLVLSIDAINHLPLVVTVVVGYQGREPCPRLPHECPRTARGERLTHGNRVLVFPAPFARSHALPGFAVRPTHRLLSWFG
jgi:mRNA-degrading endonuclease toxin of MazEF toxin-antitoxin module